MYQQQKNKQQQQQMAHNDKNQYQSAAFNLALRKHQHHQQQQQQQQQPQSDQKNLSYNNDNNDDNLKESSTNFEELFDSGYNSNVQSKTFLDLDDELSSPQPQEEYDEDEEEEDSQTLLMKNQQHKKVQRKNDNKFDNVQKQQKHQPQPQWTDSGVCITDSGLSIQDDDNYELIYSKDQTTTTQQSEESVKSYVDDAGDSNDKGKNLLEIWLKNNSDGETLLHLAIIEGLEEIACSIIQNISTSNEMLSSYNYLYQNPLHLAVLKRQMSVIQQLILKGVSLTFQDNLGNTPLHIACKYSLIDICELILTTASNKSVMKCLEILNYDGDSCLHLAAYNNDLKLLDLLLRAGANINIQEGKSGKSILHWAVENLQVHLVHFLYKNNSNIQLETFAGKTPLHFLLKCSIKNQEQQHQQQQKQYQQQSSGISGGNGGCLMIRSKINKIIRMSIDYCNEQKLSLENMNNNNNNNNHHNHMSDSDNESDNE